MKPSQLRSSGLNYFGLGAVLIAGALAAGAPLALARDAVLLGPRSLYPATNQLRKESDVPLVMRDALQHIATGMRLLAVEPRIMGGEPAPEGAFPWMASIELKLRRKDAHFCGGAFIAPQWVITAAHCVKPDSAGTIEVLGGTNTLEIGGELYPVDRVIVHEKYSTETQDYDVALLHLAKPYNGTTIRLLTAADAGRLAGPGHLAISAGWGYASEAGDVSNVLRSVTVQIVSNKTCNGLAAYAGAVTDRMICAGFPEGGKDACQGDSGGPLMVSDGKGGYFQAGITSWGEGCGRPNKFGVYTRVSTVADWVAEKIGTRAAPVASNAAPQNAKTTAAKAGPVQSERFSSVPGNPGPPELSRTSRDFSAPVSSVPLPQPRPSALMQARRRSHLPSTRTAPRTLPRGYYYYETPDHRRYIIPPSFDWRRLR